MENSNDILLAEVGSLIKVGKRTYRITNEPIKSGDLIWNEPSKSLDKCMAAFSDGQIAVEFSSGMERGMRAVFNSNRFQKVVKQR